MLRKRKPLCLLPHREADWVFGDNQYQMELNLNLTDMDIEDLLHSQASSDGSSMSDSRDVEERVADRTGSRGTPYRIARCLLCLQLCLQRSGHTVFCGRERLPASTDHDSTSGALCASAGSVPTPFDGALPALHSYLGGGRPFHRALRRMDSYLGEGGLWQEHRSCTA